MLAALLYFASAQLSNAAGQVAVPPTSHAVAATSSHRQLQTGPVCNILSQACSAAYNCACVDAASGVGGTSTCTYSTPAVAAVIVEGGWGLPDVEVFPAVPAVTLSIGAEVLPCGDPASAKLHGTISLPSGMSTYALDGLQVLAQTSAGTITWTAGTNTLTIEKSVSAGQSETVKIPFFSAGVVTADLKIIVSVGGNIDGLTASMDADLCLTLGAGSLTAEFCGANIPKCLMPVSLEASTQSAENAFCYATELNLNSKVGSPPFNFLNVQAQPFGDACGTTATAPVASQTSPPPPAPSPPPPPIQYRVEVSFTAAGDITDYADGTAAATSIKVGLATAAGAGVTADDVTLHEITSGSVNIEARILVADYAAAGTAKTALKAAMADTTVASTLLGVTVESFPGGDGMGGGAIFFLLVGLATIVCLATVAYKQREIIKEQGLRRVVKDDLAHVKENLKNGSYKEAIKKQASASKEAMKKLKPAAKKEGTPAPTDLTSTSAGKAERQAVAV